MATSLIVKTLQFPSDDNMYQINAVYLNGKSDTDFAENKLATTDNDGLMSMEDKQKIENIPSEGDVWIFNCGNATTNI